MLTKTSMDRSLSGTSIDKLSANDVALHRFVDYSIDI
jgi:hypothetical protein